MRNYRYSSYFIWHSVADGIVDTRHSSINNNNISITYTLWRLYIARWKSLSQSDYNYLNHINYTNWHSMVRANQLFPKHAFLLFSISNLYFVSKEILWKFLLENNDDEEFISILLYTIRAENRLLKLCVTPNKKLKRNLSIVIISFLSSKRICAWQIRRKKKNFR